MQFIRNLRTEHVGASKAGNNHTHQDKEAEAYMLI